MEIGGKMKTNRNRVVIIGLVVLILVGVISYFLLTKAKTKGVINENVNSFEQAAELSKNQEVVNVTESSIKKSKKDVLTSKQESKESKKKAEGVMEKKESEKDYLLMTDAEKGFLHIREAIDTVDRGGVIDSLAIYKALPEHSVIYEGKKGKDELAKLYREEVGKVKQYAGILIPDFYDKAVYKIVFDTFPELLTESDLGRGLPDITDRAIAELGGMTIEERRVLGEKLYSLDTTAGLMAGEDDRTPRELFLEEQGREKMILVCPYYVHFYMDPYTGRITTEFIVRRYGELAKSVCTWQVANQNVEGMEDYGQFLEDFARGTEVIQMLFKPDSYLWGTIDILDAFSTKPMRMYLMNHKEQYADYDTLHIYGVDMQKYLSEGVLVYRVHLHKDKGFGNGVLIEIKGQQIQSIQRLVD